MVDNQVTTYMAKIGVDGSEFTNGIQNMASNFVSLFGSAGMVVGAAAAAGAAMYKIVEEQGKMAKGMQDMALLTGMSTDAIQRFHYAANLAGDSVGMVDSMLNKLTLSMGEANDATSAQAKAFKELGVDTEGKDIEEVFLGVATGLTQMQDKGRAASLAMDVLGKSYKDSLPFMKGYLEDLEKIKGLTTLTTEEMENLARANAGINDFWSRVSIMQSQAGAGIVGFFDFEKGFNTDAYKKRVADKAAKDALANIEVVKPAIEALADPYAGWTADEVELQLQTDKVTEAQKALNEGLATGSENAKALSADYIFQKKILEELIESQKKLDEVVNPTGEVVPEYDPSLMENAPRSLGGYGDKYSQVQEILNSARLMDPSNAYARQLQALSTRASNSSRGLGGSDSWMQTGENESIANQALALKAQYDRSTNIYVNVPEGTPADMADRVAQAISRALAQQVAL